MRGHRHELGFLRIHIGRKPRKRLAQILDRSLVFGPCRVDQNEEYDNPKNAAYYVRHFHLLVRLFALLECNCNDNRMLGRGSAETDSFSAHAKNADEKTGEDCLKAKGDERCAGYDQSHCASVIQMAKVSEPPLPDCGKQQTAPSEACQRRYDQSFFQIHEFEKAFPVPVWLKESLGNGERFGKEGEEDPLITAQDGDACEQQRMRVKRAVHDAQNWHGAQINKQTKGDKCATGDEKKPTRTAHQKIAKC